MSEFFDANDAKRTIELFRAPGAVVELRIVGTHRGTVSGYFDDMEALLHEAEQWSGKAPAVYFTPNPVLPDLLARAYNRVREFAKTTTGDKEILRRTWLPIDCDAIRPADISANDGEWRAAIERAEAVRDYLETLDCPAITGDSGNGGHVSVPIDLPNDDASKDLCQSILKSLSARFSDERVKIDLTTFNASRIWKLYGTQARKGDAIPGRPHRLARLLGVPTGLVPVSRERLLTLVDSASGAKLPALAFNGSSTPHAASGDYTTLNVVAWFQSHGAYGRAMGGGKHAVECPWKSEHSTTRRADESDTCVWEAEGGAWPQFHCLHDHCNGRTIKDVLAVWTDAVAYCDRPFSNGWVVPEREAPATTEEGDIPEPLRVEALTQKAAAMRREGFAGEEIQAALISINDRHCKPPLLISAVSGITERVCRFDPNEATLWRVAAREGDFTGIEPLTRIGTHPPRYEATVKGKKIKLTLEQLKKFEEFRTRCMSELNFLPVIPCGVNSKGKELSQQTTWERDFVIPALARLPLERMEEAPDDAGQRGAAWESVLLYLRRKSPTGEDRANDKDLIHDGYVIEVDGHYVFRGPSLRQFLAINQLDILKADELYDVVRDRGGKPVTVRTKRGVAKAWQLPVAVTSVEGPDESRGNVKVTTIRHENGVVTL